MKRVKEVDYKAKGLFSLEMALVPEYTTDVDFEVKISTDGRVWINIDGRCYARFAPERK